MIRKVLVVIGAVMLLTSVASAGVTSDYSKTSRDVRAEHGWKVSPEDTARCIGEMKQIVKEARADFANGGNDAIATEIDLKMSKECNETLSSSGQYLDKDKEFTERVDAILAQK